MVSMRYGIIVPLIGNVGLVPQLPLSDFLLMVLAVVFIGAAGYAINDYFDQKIDAINRPNKIIVGKKIHRRAAILAHWIFNIAGVFIGLWLAFRVKLWWVFAVYLLVTIVFWYYSVSLKKHALLGNIAVSVMAFMVPFQVILFEFAWYLKQNMQWPEDISTMTVFREVFYMVLVYSVFAFFINLIREIIKDFEDIKGDARYKRQSLPIALGPVKAKWIVQITNALVILFIIGIYAGFVVNHDSMFLFGAYFALLIILPLILVIVKTYKAREAKSYALPGRLVKFVMLTGILFPFLFGMFQ
jgi:4-hydroxybenzoate polyprenyltransferase